MIPAVIPFLGDAVVAVLLISSAIFFFIRTRTISSLPLPCCQDIRDVSEIVQYGRQQYLLTPKKKMRLLWKTT